MAMASFLGKFVFIDDFRLYDELGGAGPPATSPTGVDDLADPRRAD
jgi:hypothetical protein